MFKFVVGALAVAGFCFIGMVVMCYAGYSRACVIDLMPIGHDVICMRANN